MYQNLGNIYGGQQIGAFELDGLADLKVRWMVWVNKMREKRLARREELLADNKAQIAKLQANPSLSPGQQKTLKRLEASVAHEEKKIAQARAVVEKSKAKTNSAVMPKANTPAEQIAAIAQKVEAKEIKRVENETAVREIKAGAAPSSLKGYGETSGTSKVAMVLLLLALVGGGYCCWKKHKASVAAKRRARNRKRNKR